MKRYTILLLAVLVGFGAFAFNAQADSARTIPMKTGIALHASTLITGNGGTLYKVMGRATSAAAAYVIYDKSTLKAALYEMQTDVFTEGGEATQYDPIILVDFGEEGIRFRSGLVIVTTTADIVVHYR